MSNQNIMVAVDFGATSLRAMDAAIELAQRMNVLWTSYTCARAFHSKRRRTK